MLDKNLTKAQKKAFEKLDETAQKHVKDSLVRNVLITAWTKKMMNLLDLLSLKLRQLLTKPSNGRRGL